MNWLAKINLGIVVQRLGAFKSALFLVALISLCLFIGYRAGNYYHHAQVSTLAQQKERLDNLYQQHEQAIEQIHTLEVELTLEQLANKEAQASIKSAAQEHHQVKKQLAFYEKIMAPEKQAGSLVVEGVKIFPTSLAHHYRFEVTLLQQQLKRRYSKGDINLTFLGSENNQIKTLKLSDVSNVSKQERSFSFQFFQVLSGEFTLPESFTPENVQLSVNLPRRTGQKQADLEKIMPWQLEKP
ncbi:hypothetical protein GCM10009111_31120 [Colwellia asteriadis]|uniref:Uncharacterized protein n=1 Tax=Colwellia asteriadis TaxID=517723 RepID=A0ABP3WJW1_9GAMM